MHRNAVCLILALILAGCPAFSQNRLLPNLEDNIDRPLRYTPDGQDFVVECGGEFFNRPLYGGNAAFRVDAGDQPEFSRDRLHQTDGLIVRIEAKALTTPIELVAAYGGLSGSHRVDAGHRHSLKGC